jgi:4,5-DOPA dioxygenase extradiol
MSQIQPMYFIGHDPSTGSCPNIEFTSALTRARAALSNPSSVLLLSCKKVTDGIRVRSLGETNNEHPLLDHLKKTINGLTVSEDPDLHPDPWSLQVMKILFPALSIPVHLMTLDHSLDPLSHYFLGRELKNLRERGMLIIALGNIIHNPSAASPDCQATPPSWARDFEKKVRKHLKERNFMTLVDHFHLGPESRMSITDSDHYLPLVYLLGAAEKKEPLKPVYEGFRYGTTSLNSFRIG